MPPAAKPSAPLALVCGDDEFAVRQRARQLFNQWSKEIGGADHETLDAAVGNSGEAIQVLSRLREALQTLPFFGTGKVVWLRDCNFLGKERTATSAEVTDALARLAEELKTFAWQGVRLLVSAGEVDKRRSFYKAIEKLGQVESFAGWTLETKDWALQAERQARKSMQERGKDIGEEALGELINRIGPNARLLDSEIEKLCLHAGDRPEITVADIAAVCVHNKQARAFALGDALGDRDLPRLLHRLDEELWEIRLKVDRDKSEIGLLYGLISKVRVLILLNEMIREGWIKPNATYDQIKSLAQRVPADRLPADKKYNPLTMHPFVLLNALKQVRNYSPAELVRAMDVLLQANRRLVSSGLDEALVLQQALVEIVGAGARRTRAAA